MDCLENNMKIFHSCRIEWNGDASFKVTHGEYDHIVDHTKETCTCRSRDIKGIPCS